MSQKKIIFQAHKKIPLMLKENTNWLVYDNGTSRSDKASYGWEKFIPLKFNIITSKK